jgi:hypothetical protein
MTPESAEFLKYRRDLEAREAFKANPHPAKRVWWESPRVKEIDPRERD